jgi:hypothetical protein
VCTRLHTAYRQRARAAPAVLIYQASIETLRRKRVAMRLTRAQQSTSVDLKAAVEEAVLPVPAIDVRSGASAFQRRGAVPRRGEHKLTASQGSTPN